MPENEQRGKSKPRKVRKGKKYAQAKYWLLTVPKDSWERPERIPGELTYLKGQEEIGESTGYRHWQLLAVFKRKVRLGAVKKLFGDGCHAEPSICEAADEYVWKEETRVPGTQFEVCNLCNG